MGFDEKKDKNLVITKVAGLFLRLTIAKKMLLGYLPLAILIILISGFALSSLERLNKMNNSIVKTDVPLIEATDKMIDILLAQDLYARRYLILQSPEMLRLFWKRSKEFDETVARIRSIPDQKDVSVGRLTSLHKEYNNFFVKGLTYLEKPSSAAAKKYESQIKRKQEELIELINKMSSTAQRNQKKKTLMTSLIGTTAFRVITVLCISSILLGIGTAMLITRNISSSVHQLKLATEKISEGKFEDIPTIQNEDELGKLSNAFNEMAKRLKQLEAMCLDASPLTRLPGNIAIENTLKNRLSSGVPIAFCLLDLDDFKPFNDRYGYARGSEVIQATARVIRSAVSEQGTYEDFIGHIGGDDYVIISSPDKFKKICNAVIEKFDKMIPDFYDPEDRSLGYIISKTRQGQKMSFPIMSISIAVVTNLNRKLINPFQVGEIAAELKEYAKSLPGSIYVVDRRREETNQETSQETTELKT